MKLLSPIESSAEFDAFGNLLKSYVHGLEIDEVLYQENHMTGETLFFHQDHLMSTLALTDASGVVKESFTYDPYGNLITRPLLPSTRFLYTGREFDSETGLYYNRARYYDPQLGRFITTDPKGYEAGLNLYTYTLNNPLTFRDPEGLDVSWGGYGGGISSFFGGIASAVSNAASSVASSIAAGIRATMNAVSSVASAVASAVTSVASSVASAVSSAAQTIGSAVSSAASAVGSAVKGAASAVGNAAKAVGSAIAGGVAKLASGVIGVPKAVGSAVVQSATNLAKFGIEQLKGAKAAIYFIDDEIIDYLPPSPYSGKIDIIIDVAEKALDGVQILEDRLERRY